MKRFLKYVLWSLGTAPLLILVLALSTPVSAAAYKDIQGHWALGVIGKWSDSGILSGYSDGTFRPNNPVTRAQLATMLYRIWGCEPVKEHFNYSDLKPDDWCYDALHTMNMYGIALNTDDKILPNEPLTREEAFYMISSAFRVSGVGSSLLRKFPDGNEVSKQFSGEIERMLGNHYISGSADGRLNPKRSITRAEVMKIIDNMFDVLITEPGTYTRRYGQNTLVLCGGEVILNLEEYKGGGIQSNRIYLMCEASKGGVSFRSLPTNTKEVSATLIAISQDSAVYTAENEDIVDRRTDRRNIILSQMFLPDTRFSGGRGQEFFPYIISTPEQFRLLVEYNSSDTAYTYFKLAKDLDLGTLSAPLGLEEERMVKARLDGGGHAITYRMENVTLTQPYGGLFYAYKGTCSNLTLRGSVDVTFAPETGSMAKNGGIAFGGFAGYYESSFTNCIADMDVSVQYNGTTAADLSIGGLAGATQYCRVDNCIASGTVKGMVNNQSSDLSAGGLLGAAVAGQLNIGGVFTNCSTSGTVAIQGGDHATAGGIIGLLTSSDGAVNAAKRRPGSNLLTSCWSTAAVSGSGASFQSDIGGLVGQLYAGTVQKSWARPTVTVNGGSFQNAGGIAGAVYTESSISDCWVNAASCASGGERHAGGITGRLAGKVSNCYVLNSAGLGKENAIAFQSWNDGTVTACTDLTGAAQEAKNAFYKTNGWDFEKIWDNSGSYPILRDCDTTAQQRAQT